MSRFTRVIGSLRVFPNAVEPQEPVGEDKSPVTSARHKESAQSEAEGHDLVSRDVARRNTHSSSFFEDFPPLGTVRHTHVHHHNHQHVYSDPRTGQRQLGQDDRRNKQQANQPDIGDRWDESPAAWEPDYPVLTPDFYDDTDRPTQHRVPSPDVKLGAQARQFFNVQRVIARSNQSIVIEARMRATQKRVAIKMITKKCDKDKRKQLLIEHKVLANHSRASPFLVQLHSAFQTRLHCYLVMEYVESGSLEERLAVVGVYPERVAVFYLAEISAAVFFLHQRGILHRDLRLRNIMLRSNGHVSLIDFGLCKIGMRDAFTSTMVGTLKEMAPEMHHNAPYNKAVDYWGMGLILYTLVHGHLPFKGKTRVDIFKSVTVEKEAYKPNLNKPTIDLCQDLLKKNQKRRLGYEQNSIHVFRKHRFFADVNWDRLHRCLYTPPYVPTEETDVNDHMTEATWPDLSEQNTVFAGTGIPRRLSLAAVLHEASPSSTDNLQRTVNKLANRRGSALSVERSPLIHLPVLVTPSAPFKPEKRDSASSTARSALDLHRDSLSGAASQKTRLSIIDGQIYALVGDPKQRRSLMSDNSLHVHSTASGLTWEIVSNRTSRCECLQNCWMSCVNMSRVEAATCRALCCGLENVAPPVLMEVPVRGSVSASFFNFNVQDADTENIDSVVDNQPTPGEIMPRATLDAVHDNELHVESDLPTSQSDSKLIIKSVKKGWKSKI